MVNIATARRRVMPSRITDSDYFPFEGGLNLVDTPLKIRPGQLLAVKNYEPGIRGGYRSVLGYERLDGHTEPSQAAYWTLGYEDASAIAAVGNTINQTAAGSAVVLATVVEQPISIVNLLTNSEDISALTFSGATPLQNAISDPVRGDQVADRITESAGLAQHLVTFQVSKPAGAITYWLSWYVRANGRSRLQLAVASPSNPINLVQTNIDLFNRAIGAATATAGFVALDEYLLDVGGGWYRAGLKFTSTAETAMAITLRLADSGGAVIYVGDGASGAHVFGRQLEVTTADSVEPGAYVPSDAIVRGNGSGYYVLARLNGTFSDQADLRLGTAVIGVIHGVEQLSGGDTDVLDLQYRQLAIEDARMQIGQVPGAGRLLGVAVYNGVTYAFRNNTGGTAAQMFRSTPIGWSLISLGSKLRFDAGTSEIFEGDTVIGASSGASGVVRRVVRQTGTWGSDATGYLVIPTITGTFLDNEVVQVSSANRAIVNGTATPQALAPNGSYEFRIHNFYGHTKQRRLYGVDGVNRAFEFQDNPSAFVQIETGMTIDTPNHLGVHQKQLWLMFPGGSIQKSSVGDPATWLVVLGAAELGIGDEGTGFLEEIGDTLFVFARDSTYYVFGTPEAYELKLYNGEVGASPGTIQRIGRGLYLDDRGFSTLSSTQKYGNYAYNSISALIQPLIKQLKLQSTCSVTVKDDNLYRAFFADGRFISIGLQDNKISGFTSCEYPHIVRCAFAGEDASGQQMIVFGSDDGFVYRAERGTSFDGQEIETFLRPVYFFSRTPSRRKRYRRAQFDVRVTGDLTLDIAVDYSFGDSDDPAETVRTIQLGGGGGIYGAAIWGQFKWGQGSAPEAIIKLEGAGINIGFLLASRSKVAEPHSIEGVNLHHSQRRINRGTSYA